MQKCKSARVHVVAICVCVRAGECMIEKERPICKDIYQPLVCHLHTHPLQQTHRNPHCYPPSCNISMMVPGNHQVDCSSNESHKFYIRFK